MARGVKQSTPVVSTSCGWCPLMQRDGSACHWHPERQPLAVANVTSNIAPCCELNLHPLTEATRLSIEMTNLPAASALATALLGEKTRIDLSGARHQAKQSTSTFVPCCELQWHCLTQAICHWHFESLWQFCLATSCSTNLRRKSMQYTSLTHAI